MSIGILCYINDVLFISHNQQKSMKRIREDFKIKDDNIEPSDIYIGATLSKMNLYSGKYCWIMSPEQYVKASVTNVEEDLVRSGKILP